MSTIFANKIARIAADLESTAMRLEKARYHMEMAKIQEWSFGQLAYWSDETTKAERMYEYQLSELKKTVST